MCLLLPVQPQLHPRCIVVIESHVIFFALSLLHFCVITPALPSTRICFLNVLPGKPLALLEESAKHYLFSEVVQSHREWLAVFLSGDDLLHLHAVFIAHHIHIFLPNCSSFEDSDCWKHFFFSRSQKRDQSCDCTVFLTVGTSLWKGCNMNLVDQNQFFS